MCLFITVSSTEVLNCSSGYILTCDCFLIALGKSVMDLYSPLLLCSAFLSLVVIDMCAVYNITIIFILCCLLCCLAVGELFSTFLCMLGTIANPAPTLRAAMELTAKHY